MYQLKSEKANYGINIPTNPNEINADVLKTLTENIQLSKNYAILALRYKVKPFDLIMGAKSQKSNVLVSVVPLLAKVNGEINGNIGDRVSITSTDLQMALHISSVSVLSPDTVKNYIIADDALNKSVINKTAFADAEFIYLLEFKIVSLNAIKAIIVDKVKDDPFVV